MDQSRRDFTSERHREGGVIYVLFLILLISAVLPVLAYVIDIGRAEYAGRQLQAAADAAALAAATELKGYQGRYLSVADCNDYEYTEQIGTNGVGGPIYHHSPKWFWNRAIRAAFIPLKHLPIYGDSREVQRENPSFVPTITYSGGATRRARHPYYANPAFDDPTTEYTRGDTYQYPRLTVQVQRGTYAQLDDGTFPFVQQGSSNFIFVPLEGGNGDYRDCSRATYLSPWRSRQRSWRANFLNPAFDPLEPSTDPGAIPTAAAPERNYKCTPASGATPCCCAGLANGAKVTLTLRMPSTFGKILGPGLGSIEIKKSAVSARSDYRNGNFYMFPTPIN